MELGKFVWSLDISTTNIGSSLFDATNGKLIEMKHLELKTDKNVLEENRDIFKAEIFKNYVSNYKKHVLDDLNGEIIHIAVEEPIGGSNNAFTVAKLFNFNGMARYILFNEFNIYPKKISVHDGRLLFLVDMNKVDKNKTTLSFPKGWKSAEKKKYIWSKVSKLESNITWFYKKNTKELADTNWDLADSYVTGIAYLIMLKIITNDNWKKRYNSI